MPATFIPRNLKQALEAKDVDAWLAFFAPDAESWEYNSPGRAAPVAQQDDRPRRDPGPPDPCR